MSVEPWFGLSRWLLYPLQSEFHCNGCRPSPFSYLDRRLFLLGFAFPLITYAPCLGKIPLLVLALVLFLRKMTLAMTPMVVVVVIFSFLWRLC